MLIKRMVGTNFLGLLNLDIEADGRSIKLIGRNEAGKTSCIYLANAALEGMSKREVPWQAQPVHHRSDGKAQPTKAEAILVLTDPSGGDVTVHRTFREKEGGRVVTSLKITPKSALGDETPQSWLNRLFTVNSMDPWAFVRADAEKQVEILCQSIGIEEQRKALKAELEYLIQERLEIGRDLKRATGAADNEPLPPKPPAVDSTDWSVQALRLQQQHSQLAKSLQVSKDEFNSAARRFDQARKTLNEREDALKEAQQELRVAEKAMKKSVQLDRESLSTALEEAGYTAEKDEQLSVWASRCVDDLEEKAQAAQEKRVESVKAEQQRKDYKRYQKIVEERDELEASYQSGTQTIREKEQELVELLAGADLPVEGLELTSKGLAKDGVPLSQCSSSAVLRLSMLIEMAVMDRRGGSDRLRVIILKDGGQFDADRLDELLALAEERGVQLIVEQAIRDRELAMFLDEATDEAIAARLRDMGVMTVAVKDGRAIG